MSDVIERAKRPTQEFLDKAGIDTLPPNIDILFYEPSPVSDSTAHKQIPPAFLVRSFDGERLVAEKSVKIDGPSEDVYEKLRSQIKSLVV